MENQNDSLNHRNRPLQNRNGGLIYLKFIINNLIISIEYLKIYITDNFVHKKSSNDWFEDDLSY
ncbi:hypothetical protein LPB90_19330 [Chryseobacterium sp. LC2016-29]|uniref:hypothetical protein n=1 Tax=Chryseobacterium sp. LC2016-29 TaxID=2897331 RepID=UPI001E2BE05A|nr:hypothetical protein [Chryseobacterium sp. LC2016-29]MCD0480600.1 hypothetical protein [Chryseobacterium sp. LC2016-29]